MATGTRVCRVCGKEYKYCKTNRREGIFRWQDVACSPEHGAIYFARIEASRAMPAKNEVVITDDFDDDYLEELFDEEDDFFADDSEEEIEIEKE